MYKSILKQSVFISAMVLVLAGSLFAVTAVSADPGTAFSYQGQLLDSNGAVNDTCDIQFGLYDALSGGSQIGTTDTHTSTVVTDGLFTVELDFGVNAFDGAPRWIELAARCPAGSGGYDTLSPRQPLTPTPYAIYATQAMTATLALSVGPNVITPTHMNGITTTGTIGQVLTSDGSGGFDWQSSAGASVKQIATDFVMASGESVSAGDVVAFLNGEAYSPDDGFSGESTFNAATSSRIGVAVLNSTSFVVAYTDEGNSEYGTAIVGTVSGGSLSWGSESVFNTASTYWLSVCALSDTSFVVVYMDAGNSFYGTGIAGTVSGGNSLSWGSEAIFNNANTGDINIAALSGTAVVVAYSDAGNSSYGTAAVGTVSGSALSWGSESTFNSVSTSYTAVAAPSSSSVVVAYRDGGTNFGTAIAATVSGNSLSWGSASTFNTDDTSSIGASALPGTNNIVIAYSAGMMSSQGAAIVATVSGGSLSWGGASVFNSAGTSYVSVTALSANDFVVAYSDSGNSNHGTLIKGAESGGSLSWGEESVFNAAYTEEIGAGALSGTDFAVAYKDGGNSNHGMAIVGSNIGRLLIGTARNAASGGQTVSVIVNGVSDVHSGLTPGKMYYLQNNGSLGTTMTSHRIGLAVSATELILDQLW